jgi:hypothetical protein
MNFMSLKKCMRLHIFCLEGGLVSLKRMLKTEFYTSRQLKNEEIEGIFVFGDSEL